MPELGTRLSCPVCLGVVMHRVMVGATRQVEVDLCRRCGGIWLEHGEVQRLRSHHQQFLRTHFDRNTPQQIGQCHQCHAPLCRDIERCHACGHVNLLDCPSCARGMRVVWHGPLRLDVCDHCKGTWFDHHELSAIWGPQFDLALQRHYPVRHDGTLTTSDVGDIALHGLFYTPDLLMAAGMAAGEAASAAGSALTQLPEAVAASPEAASVVIEVIAETASGVFEVVVEIVAGIFS
jgi:Zn-finger nucleic acid-binding protein